MESPPMRGRGLKLICLTLFPIPTCRPHAGAWIETECNHIANKLGMSPPMRGRGLKHSPTLSGCNMSGRPPCGGVD